MFLIVGANVGWVIYTGGLRGGGGQLTFVIKFLQKIVEEYENQILLLFMNFITCQVYLE